MSRSNHAEIEPLEIPTLTSSDCSAASLLPQSGQRSKPMADAPPITRVMASRCMVTSVRIVRLVGFADGSERKELARLDSHW
jgi:hypothetical protein